MKKIRHRSMIRRVSLMSHSFWGFLLRFYFFPAEKLIWNENDDHSPSNKKKCDMKSVTSQTLHDFRAAIAKLVQ